MWTELEGNGTPPRPMSWKEVLEATVSGLGICLLILAVFAAAG